jgi:hypothetical protein
MYLESTLNKLQMVFSLGHLVIFGGKPENCEIPDSFRENPYNFDRIGI